MAVAVIMRMLRIMANTILHLNAALALNGAQLYDGDVGLSKWINDQSAAAQRRVVDLQLAWRR